MRQAQPQAQGAQQWLGWSSASWRDDSVADKYGSTVPRPKPGAGYVLISDFFPNFRKVIYAYSAVHEYAMSLPWSCRTQ